MCSTVSTAEIRLPILEILWEGIFWTGRGRTLGAMAALPICSQEARYEGVLICFLFTPSTCSGCETCLTKAREIMRFQSTRANSAVTIRSAV